MTKLLLSIFIKDYKNTFDKMVRQKYGFLSSIVGIIVNILLFAGKCLAGILTGAISIIADAFNNLSDAGSSIVTLVGFRISMTPPDEEHPFGHGRAEYISGLIISFIIMIMGVELAKTSFDKIFNPEEINFSFLSVGILVVSVLVKLWLCFFNRKLGKLVDSVTMKATAMDSLSDVIATTSVIIGILISNFTGINIDGYVGILVAAFIIFSGFKTAKDSLSPLLGQMPDDTLVRDIEKTICDYHDIIGVHDLIVHNYGVGVSMISLHAEVPASMDFIEAHELIDVIEDDLKIKYKCNATIHMDPVVVDDEETNLLRKAVKSIATEIDPALTTHDLRMTKGIYQSNLIFDVVVPFRFRMSDNELKNAFEEKIREIDDKYCVVINVDKKMSNLD